MTEISNVLDDSTPKARKPYTISKQREKWSEDEHNKFLEALQLYSRNWRRIEEHIGTKTTIQIRSHAQKFFSKVARESNNKESINIPPPRPKRKPAHPYPRKLGNAKPGKQIPVLKNSEMGEQESSSPLSVLSTEFMSPVVGSSETDNEPDKLSNNMESEENCENEEICEESVSLKLFGKTVNPAQNSQNADTNIQFAPENTEMDIESSTTSTTEQSEVGTNAYNNNNYNYNISNPFLCYNYCAPQLLFWNPYGNMSYLIKPEPVSPKVNTLEENIIESNNNYSQKMSNNMIDLGRPNEEKSLRGFVPYKRCVAEIEKVETRLCL